MFRVKSAASKQFKLKKMCLGKSKLLKIVLLSQIICVGFILNVDFSFVVNVKAEVVSLRYNGVNHVRF